MITGYVNKDKQKNTLRVPTLSAQKSINWTIFIQLLRQLSELSYRTTIHTDQGWQYHHRSWRKALKQTSIIQSISRRATALDNSTESFINKLKVEIEPLNNYSSAKELIETFNTWIKYYNNTPIQTNINGYSPVVHRQMAT
ncbi:hypothetical protein EFL81_10605 [Weissella confusa]|nr:hypothetical protein [Weissella confusa]